MDCNVSLELASVTSRRHFIATYFDIPYRCCVKECTYRNYIRVCWVRIPAILFNIGLFYKEMH